LLAGLLPDDEAARAIEQFQTYRIRGGFFGLAAARSQTHSSNPCDWWASYGCGVRELQQLAMKVLSQPASASSSEQNWSQYDYVHDKRRNRLKPNTASKLVFIYTSLRVCLNHTSYKRHLEFTSRAKSIVPIEDQVDGNASDADCEEVEVSDED